IGAEPATSWLTGIATEDDGFIRTDVQLADDDLGPAWGDVGRKPLPFETTVPGVFAVGDVRSGSMKRVAAATGEGASAIASVHKAIATLAHRPPGPPQRRPRRAGPRPVPWNVPPPAVRIKRI